MNQTNNKSPIGWVMSFAGRKKPRYTASVFAAMLGVLCGIMPYVITGILIRNLIAGNQDWSFCLRQGLLMAVFWLARVPLFPLPLARICYATMMIGYTESYQNAVNKTQILNDTTVEYINGIEVIKAFGKAKASYERFVVAAREGACCYVDWMKKNSISFSLAMVMAPWQQLT